MGTVLFLTETASDRVISAAVKYIFKKPTMLKSQILACLVLGVLMINVAEGGKLKKLILMKMMAAQHQQGGYGGSSGGYGAMEDMEELVDTEPALVELVDTELVDTEPALVELVDTEPVLVELVDTELALVELVDMAVHPALAMLLLNPRSTTSQFRFIMLHLLELVELVDMELAPEELVVTKKAPSIEIQTYLRPSSTACVD